ncbi:MAG: hypothetical protein Q8P11_02430, partial [bacterium]|nr:hypothetical protein [bacterium]
MSLVSLDYLAYHSHSSFSRASVWVKLLLIVVVLSGIVISDDIRLLLSLYLVSLFVLILSSEEAFFELFIASLYPLIFAVILVLGFYGFSWSI